MTYNNVSTLKVIYEKKPVQIQNSEDVFWFVSAKITLMTYYGEIFNKDYLISYIK